MKTLKIKFSFILAFGLAIVACEGPEGPTGPQGPQGLQGEQGQQGPAGPDGNANVQTFDFTVMADDWSNNLHAGSSNIFREYFIPSEATGGIAVNSFFNTGGAIVIYANAHHDGGGSLGGWHLLPYLYRSVDGIGVKLVFFASRGSVAITRTTSGWDHLSISEDHLPDSVDYRMVFIENIDMGKIPSALLDEYEALAGYFGIPD